jgi:NAD(P)-dependent dehydrogenase (short-subunit alcohol dehydrogenase family)
MKEGSKIITISTFFTEEKPYEQRPYRFRSPYTAAQGAKNRLVEAMSWELADKGIISIGTNPGPVHSDRIYKTVYPKAAAEFLRVSGFEELDPNQVETAAKEILGVLGEDEETVKNGINAAAEKLGIKETTLTNLLNKIQSIAEKIQKNTSTMIADNQFLSQDQVATTILTLADDEQAKILNGKVIPGDRVFYHVKPHVTSSIPKIEKNNLDGKKFWVSVNEQMDYEVKEKMESLLEEQGAKDITDEEFDSGKSGDIRIIMTGDVDPNTELIGSHWHKQVNQFILYPAEQAQIYLNERLVPGGSEDPRKYKDTKGRIIIIGPRFPRTKTKEGEKIAGAKLSKARAKAEVFRGALRPFVTTVNQELSDVLKSNIRVFLILPGSVEGKESSDENLMKTINYLMSDEAGSNPEVIFCPDESR